MPLIAYNMTAASLALAAGNPTALTLPASLVAGTPSMPIDVTTRLRPNLTVDPIHGVAGGLAKKDFQALDDQQETGDVRFVWLTEPSYNTSALKTRWLRNVAAATGSSVPPWLTVDALGHVTVDKSGSPESGYCETAYNDDMNPTSVTWYRDATKAVKVFETLVTYTGQLATTVVTNFYIDGVYLVAAVTEAITYDGDGYELTRTRTKTP